VSESNSGGMAGGEEPSLNAEPEGPTQSTEGEEQS
jgi:hypothetical protein